MDRGIIGICGKGTTAGARLAPRAQLLARNDNKPASEDQHRFKGWKRRVQGKRRRCVEAITECETGAEVDGLYLAEELLFPG